MRSFKKAFLSALCFLCVVALVSAGLLFLADRRGDSDSAERRALAGTVDLLVVGSSHAKNGFVPEILDEELGCHSYDLTGWVVPMYAKALLTEKELARNPVRHVLVEIAWDTLARDNAQDYCEGDEAVVMRLDSWGERLQYMHEFLSLNDRVNVLSRMLWRGVESIYQRARDVGGEESDARGYYRKESNDMTLKPERAAAYRGRTVFSTETWRANNIADLERLLALCRDSGAEPTIVTAPTSDNFLWTMANMDEFRTWMEEFCAEHGCAYYDFDLLRSRYELFSDAGSFHDVTHLADSGARAFTKVCAEILRRAWAGEDVRGDFYPSYEEALRDSPYAAMTQSAAG